MRLPLQFRHYLALALLVLLGLAVRSSATGAAEAAGVASEPPVAGLSQPGSAR